MQDLITRLQNGSYNNLEDLLLEASDRCKDPDGSRVLAMLAPMIPRKIKEVEVDVENDAFEDARSKGHNEGYHEGRKDGIHAVLDLDIVSEDEELVTAIQKLL